MDDGYYDYDEALVAREPLPWSPTAISARVREYGTEPDIGQAVGHMLNLAHDFGDTASIYLQHADELELLPAYVQPAYEHLHVALELVRTTAHEVPEFLDIAERVREVAKSIHENLETPSQELIDAATHLSEWAGYTSLEIRGREESRRVVEKMKEESRLRYEREKGRVVLR